MLDRQSCSKYSCVLTAIVFRKLPTNLRLWVHCSLLQRIKEFHSFGLCLNLYRLVWIWNEVEYSMIQFSVSFACILQGHMPFYLFLLLIFFIIATWVKSVSPITDRNYTHSTSCSENFLLDRACSQEGGDIIVGCEQQQIPAGCVALPKFCENSNWKHCIEIMQKFQYLSQVKQ